jgi:Kef-type K+ transport system membrane component KefB/nucleotide-binding universal stress UspA family protein
MSSAGLLSEPLPRFITQIGLILLTSRVLGLGVRKLGQPMVIAEITAGIVLGPSLFGLVWPQAYTTVFAPDSLKILSLVSQLGLVLFMFLIGLELDPAMLRGRTRASVTISHASIVVPFALGGVLAVFLREGLSQPGVPFLSFALFLGAAMSITAFPVLARILSEQRLLKTKVGALTITCAAVDDVTAWCILAFVVATTRATGLIGAVHTTLWAGVYIVLMLFLVRPLLARVAARFPRRETLTQNVVAGTLLVLFASSFITELIGIHALFGAFLFGSILPKEGGFARALADKLGELVLVVLLPLFFAYSGVRTQIGLLSTVESWAICALIIATACIGKFGASTVAARLTGLSWRESSTVGVLMNTRGLMELIVLNIGLDLGVIGPTLFTMMVVMALVTTFMTTPLLHLLYPPSRQAAELSAPTEPTSPALSPAFTVLVCVANEKVGPSLSTLTSALCRGSDARVYALSLPRPNEAGSFSEHTTEEQMQASVAPLLARASALSLPVQLLSFASADPAADISRVATAKAADLVLLGSHKPVLGQSLLGGAVYRVMQGTPRDVSVLIDRGLAEVRRVLVPFLGTPHDFAALALARRILENPDAEVTVLHVVARDRRTDAETTPLGAEAAVSTTFREVAGSRVDFRVIEADAAADAVLSEARTGYDLVIVGMGREYGLEQRPFGLQRERLLSECPVSLLVVRRAGTEEPAEAPSSRRREDWAQARS